MQRKTKYLAAVATVLTLFFVATIWSVNRLVSFVREIPNRIEIRIDEDELADTFGTAMIRSLHAGLNDDDPAMQTKTLAYFADWIEHDNAAIPWVRDEFSPELTALSSSPDVDVANAASNLLATVADSESNASQDGE